MIRVVHAHIFVVPNPTRVEGRRGAVFLQLVRGNLHGNAAAAPGKMGEVREQVRGLLLLLLSISTLYYYCTGYPLLHYCGYHHYFYHLHLLLLPLLNIQCITPI